MKKIKTLLLSLFLVSVSYMAEAQSIRVMYPSSDNISEETASVLYNRLNQAVTLNGIGSTDNSNKLLITSIALLTHLFSPVTFTTSFLYIIETLNDFSIFFANSSSIKSKYLEEK